MPLVPDTCYRALATRDPRFDGLFFVGVTTTGIYCRPVCRARTPGRDRCRFFASAAEAERDGFRACFRCRPELAPGAGREVAPVDAGPALVAAAARRIGEGALNEGSVTSLATSLGVSARHLHRALVAGLGVSPVELAQTQRLAFAKRLLQDSSLGLAEVAFAAGFQSVRRFNAAFRERFGRAPGALRAAREAGAAARGSGDAEAGGPIQLRLDYRPPLAWRELLGFLGPRAIPGVEAVEGDTYRRTVALGDRTGWVEVAPARPGHALVATASLSLAGALVPLAARLRHLFDLDARPDAIAEQLGRDPLLGRIVRARPGLRVPGAFDGFEAAVRAVLGQQVTVKGATTLAGRLVTRFGTPVETPHAGLSATFPGPAALAAAGVDALAKQGMPGARAGALVALGEAVRDGLRLAPGAPVEATLAALAELPGFGPWTTQYVAMRALGYPDAFPAGDLGVRKAFGVLLGHEPRPAELLQRAESWRPWRAYATLHLWTSGGTA